MHQFARISSAASFGPQPATALAEAGGRFRPRPFNLAYFVHDLSDPAVAKRVRMMTRAGARVRVAGFRRCDTPISEIEGAEAIDLGRTYDARLVHRAFSVARQAFLQRLGRERWAGALEEADIIVARNLEMLALAAAAQRRYARHAGIAYECLDIHRLLLSRRIAGKCLRAFERRLMKRVKLILVSSPAFLEHYFGAVQRVRDIPSVLIENKIFDPAPRNAARRGSYGPPPGPPWRIGWFGMIRCKKSFDALCALARARPDLVQVVIRGRPAYTELTDFDAALAQAEGVRFGGSYRHDELEEMYGAVHFNWAIDFFEEGANSAWLLPNRIYEGGYHCAVPIALKGTETGRWLTRNGLGVLLDNVESGLTAFLQRLTAEKYLSLKQASRNAPPGLFAFPDEDCERLARAFLGPERAASEFDCTNDAQRCFAHAEGGA